MLALALLAVAIFTIFWNIKRIKLPPGPLNLPVIGSLYLLGPLPHVALKKLSDKYGEIMYLKLGTVPYVVFSSASMAKEIFGTYSHEFASKKPTIVGMQIGNNFSGMAFGKYTPHYIFMRKIVVNQLLAPSRLRLYQSVRRAEQLTMAKAFHRSANQPVQIRDKLHEHNLNIITCMLFGERYCISSTSETSMKLHEFLSILKQASRMFGEFNISEHIPAIRWLDVQGMEKRMKQLMSVLNKSLLSMIDEHRMQNNCTNKTDEPSCFVDTLLSLEGKDKLSDISIASLILEVILGAFDTSALSAEWGLTELVRHPQKLERLEAELHEVVGNDRFVEEADLPNLPYLEAIAKETLRLHPLVPIVLSREVTSACTIKGYKIPAGMGAMINLGAILKDENRWEKSLDFYPERFMEKHVDIFGMGYDLLPFGVGRRMCPGAKLGYETFRVVLATLVQGFTWSLPVGSPEASELDMGETLALVCHKTEPLVVIPSPRMRASVYEC